MKIKRTNHTFNRNKSHSMTHSSNICNYPPPMPLRNDLGLAVKIFWGRGQKKKLSAGILLIVTKSVSLNHFLSSESSWKHWPARRRTHNHTALSLAARQTEETASYHKSVSHVPNGYHEGWVFLPPQLSLGRHTEAEFGDKLFVS